MTRILIPRSDNSSSKIIEASDWEKYFTSDIIENYVVSGLAVTAQCPNILAVDVGVGSARLLGLVVCNSTSCAVTCLTACSTNKIYAQICRDGTCEPEAFTFGTTTGCLPAESILIGNAVTNATTVTSVCSSTVNTHNGLSDVCSIFGTGADGAGTNPALTGGCYKQYTCLTISCCTSWSGCGDIIVRVSGTFNIAACKTLTLSNGGVTRNEGGVGGSGAQAAGGDGGTGAKSRGTVIIIADAVTGTGTITSTGIAGSTGSNGSGCGVELSGSNGCSPSTAQLFSGQPSGDVAVYGGWGTRPGFGAPGCGATSWGSCDVSGLFNLNNLLTNTFSSGGAGGGEGAQTNACNVTAGGGGGGAGSPFVSGGAGGTGGGTSDAGGGGGGGGGAPALLILITKTITAISVDLTGGAGGNGGTSGAQGKAGGGGGAGAGWLLVAATDNTGGTLTGGAGGTSGTSGGGTSGIAGTTGSTNKIYSTWVDFKPLLRVML